MERCPSWLKEHAWKACVGQKLTAGSNPALSAIFLERCRSGRSGRSRKSLSVVWRTVGSNPTLSAIYLFEIKNFFITVLDDFNFIFFLCLN